MGKLDTTAVRKKVLNKKVKVVYINLIHLSWIQKRNQTEIGEKNAYVWWLKVRNGDGIPLFLRLKLYN